MPQLQRSQAVAEPFAHLRLKERADSYLDDNGLGEVFKVDEA